MNTDPRPEEAPPVPTCYRHPGRETYVRCTRCDRYICPDCMRDAAVGHQCVECVRDGNRGLPQPRTIAGGRLATLPMVTYSLMAINVVAFLVQSAQSSVERRFALFPLAVADGEYYRLATSAFLHYGVLHLALNMWALYVVGQALEAWLGRTRFLALYALSALGGSVMVYQFSSLNTLTAGASGAIFGMFGAMFVMARRMNFDVRPIALLIVLNLAITFGVSGISWQGHIGGLIAGSVMAAAYAYAPRSGRFAVQAGATVAAVALLAVAVILRTSELTGQFG